MDGRAERSALPPWPILSTDRMKTSADDEGGAWHTLCCSGMPMMQRPGPLLVLAVAAAATAVASAFAAPDAHAQEPRQELLEGKHRTSESPQNFAFELRFLPYLPNVDSDPTLHGATPYNTTFGSAQRFMAAAEFDWQTVRIPHVGTLGPGVAIGYTNISDPAQFSTPHNGVTTSGETTTLEIVPMYAVAVLRADVLWREVGIPIVPYVKAGLGYALWRASNTLGTSHYPGPSGDIVGEGSTLGTQLAIGVGLNLNVFDTYSATNFDDSVGVNGTYLFGELMRADLTGLGIQKDPLRVGDSTWVLGLAFEF
jgi:hypothetical protein